MHPTMIYTIREILCDKEADITYLFAGTMSEAIAKAIHNQHSAKNTLSIEWPEGNPIAIREYGMWKKV